LSTHHVYVRVYEYLAVVTILTIRSNYCRTRRHSPMKSLKSHLSTQVFSLQGPLDGWH